MNSSSQVLNIPIEDIIPNRFQPRIAFDENALRELAASIKEHGIIQPLVLRKLGDKYEIIAGERRYKAAKMAGLLSVPGIITIMDDRKSAEVAIVENVQRKDLTSIEEAKSYKALLDKGYLTQEELAKKMGLSQSAISNKLRLLNLPEKIQDALMIGKISERHARSLLQLDNSELQLEYLDKIINERLTVKELDKIIKNEMDSADESPLILEPNPLINDNIISDNTNNFNETIDNNLNVNAKKDNPNRFFNFLENMENKEQNIEEINNLNVNKEVNEEIELLDFDLPTIKKDFNEANILIDKLIADLKSKNYTVSLIKDENNQKMKYVIELDKE